jgi:signal peptidase I
MTHRSRPFAVLVAIASLTALGFTIATARHVGIVIVALVVAVGWSAVIAGFDAVTTWPRRPAETPRSTAGSEPSSVAFVVSLGAERPDIARTSLLLAAQAGEVHVVATSHHDAVEGLGAGDVTEHIAPTIQAAVHVAATATTADVVLLLSASAFPVAATCAAAAARMTDDVGWVIGTAPAFNTDRYAPRERELLTARVRSATRQLGLVTWEPDATMVRTSLLRDHPFDAEKPFGHWLRARSREGYRGLSSSEPFSIQAAPADAPAFWPARTIRQRGVVADLADVMARGRLRHRLLSAGCLMRELFAYSFLAWLLAIVLIGRSGDFPLRVAPLAFFSLQAALAGARWCASRTSYGIGLHPVEEARATAYDLPGSLMALPSALTRRVRRARFTLPDQPMLWLAVAVTLIATAPLVDRRAETNGAIGVAVGITLAGLVTAWVFAIRAFGARGWDRASYRLVLDRAATVNGRPARTLDASPSGLGLTGIADTFHRGEPVTVEVALDAANCLELHGTVTDHRVAGGDSSIGVALDLLISERSTWVRALFSAAGLTGRVPTLPEARPARRPLAHADRPARVRRALGVLVPGTVLVIVSALVTCALIMVFLGYRPIVERSASMVPTLKIGDIVVTEWVHPDRIHTGDLVTFPYRVGPSRSDTELVTHRVEQHHVMGDRVRFVTRGDANVDVERWSAGSHALVGRVVWHIPRAGAVLIRLGSAGTRLLLLAVAAGVLALYGLVVLRPRIRRPVSA